MNNVADLMYRLLKLFSVKTLKEFFNVEAANQEQLITEIIRLNTSTAIQRFAVNHINTTRQHVYFFRLRHRFNRNSFVPADFPFPLISEDVNHGVYKFRILPVIDHNVVIINPFLQTNMEFLQPVVLTIDGHNMHLQFTILEKNIGSYVALPQKVVNTEKITDEEAIKASIVDYLNDINIVSICDINRGIKHLWDTDVIDARHLKFKKPASTSTESMDGILTVKQEYPDVYNNLINAPLHKTAFNYLRQDDSFCSHFATDPTAGQLSIPIFPNNLTQVENVISEIIQNN